MTKSANYLDEFTVTDDMLAILTLSPPQTLTQLTVTAEHPKPVTKAKYRGKKTHTTFFIPHFKHKETDERHGTMPPVSAVCPLRMRWRKARDDHWRVELACSQTTAQCCNASGGQRIQFRRYNAGEGAVRCK